MRYIDWRLAPGLLLALLFMVAFPAREPFTVWGLNWLLGLWSLALLVLMLRRLWWRRR